MSLAPMMKKCPSCRRRYPFNPDVGQGLYCPYCVGKILDKRIWEKLRKLIEKMAKI